MKKIIILFSILISTCHAQVYPSVSDFLISGNDNTPSTFLQYAPELSVTNSQNFLMLWWDYREGNPSVYAQKFDSAGNKIGANFNTNSNIGSYLKKNGYLLSLDQVTSTSVYFPYFGINASLFNDLNNQIINAEIFSGLIPECGTGFIQGEYLVAASDSSFYFLTNYSGLVSLVKMEDKGSIKHIPVLEERYNITQITASATSEGNYFFGWINGNQYDSLETGLYATFINPKDSVVVPYLFISKLNDSVKIWDYIGNYNLKSVALNDSIYKLFWLNKSTFKLYSVKLNTNGEIISDIDSMSIPKSEPEFSEPEMQITNINEESFYLSLSVHYWPTEIFQNTFIKYNLNGEIDGEMVSQNSQSRFFSGEMFNLGGNNFFKPYSDEKDVYLEKTEFTNSINKVKINDDESGSNEENKGLTIYNNNTIFPVWNDEEKSYGRRIDREGNPVGEKTHIPSGDILFFPDGKLISTWVKEINDSTFDAGYSFLDQDFQEIFSKTLFSGPGYYNVSIKAYIISDSSLILTLKTYQELKLILENKDGITIKEKMIVSGEDIYDLKIFFEESKAFFWLLWNDKLRQYGFDLEPRTDIKSRTTPYAYSNYIGNDRFLIVSTAYDYFYNNIAILGTIVNSDGDTTANNVHLAYCKSSEYNLLIDRLDENEFLVTWKNGNKFYGRAFSNEGIAAKDSFLINRSSSSFNKDLRFSVNDDKVYFTWSSAKRAAYGFDIFGSIFNLNTITSVDGATALVPKEFYIYQNYPNPFNPLTKIKFDVPGFSHVSIKIYDILGREIYSLLDQDKSPGAYFIDFNGNNFASGVYFYKITAANYTAVKKMILIK
ncbi:MAG TPA: T9SS type A sorting domain-containing protein [Ignavibacteriaceae bacterium]|nr:T9SS type A sorting domain-containing protein [Ignavibacteriaceae bacterium]